MVRRIQRMNKSSNKALLGTLHKVSGPQNADVRFDTRIRLKHINAYENNHHHKRRHAIQGLGLDGS